MRTIPMSKRSLFGLAVLVVVLAGAFTQTPPARAAGTESLSPTQGVVSLDVNGEQIKGAVRAVCNLETGELYLEATLDRAPASFNSLLAMMPISLTGQPRCSRSVSGAANPFREASGISFRRTVTFDSGEQFVADVSYKVSAAGVDATYQLRGTVPNVTVEGTVEPTVESWIPGKDSHSVMGTLGSVPGSG